VPRKRANNTNREKNATQKVEDRIIDFALAVGNDKHREDPIIRKLSILGSYLVSQLMFALPAAQAASEKADVCHREGSGNFLLDIWH